MPVPSHRGCPVQTPSTGIDTNRGPICHIHSTYFESELGPDLFARRHLKVKRSSRVCLLPVVFVRVTGCVGNTVIWIDSIRLARTEETYGPLHDTIIISLGNYRTSLVMELRKAKYPKRAKRHMLIVYYLFHYPMVEISTKLLL